MRVSTLDSESINIKNQLGPELYILKIKSNMELEKMMENK